MKTDRKNHEPTLRSRMRAAWLCKNIGGTLGAPYEGHAGFLHLCHYDPVPTEPAPNDDLDLQLVWMQALRRHGLLLTPAHLAECWERNITYHISEYHSAQRNLRRGLLAPVTGSFDNWYTAGMGAAIRTEVWACIAAGDPLMAALYAHLDASLDHAGDGTHAEVFFAVLESLAFNGGEKRALLDEALCYIPDDCDMARAVRMAMELHAGGTSLHAARALLIARFGHPADFTHSPLNIAFTVFAFLHGEDFASAICDAANCGYDTDCTAASVASLHGILHGEESIPAEWIAPIGEEIKSGWGVRDVEFHHTIDALVDEVMAWREEAAARRGEIIGHLLRWTGARVLDGPGKRLAPPPANVATLCSDARLTLRLAYARGPIVDDAGRCAGALVLENHGDEPLDARGAVLGAGGDALARVDCRVAPRDEARVALLAHADTHGTRWSVALEQPAPGELPAIVFMEPRRWRVLDLPAADTARREAIEARETLDGEPDAREVLVHGDRIAHLVPPAGTVRLAQVALHADAPTRVRLVLNSTGPVAAWLDGAMLCDKRHQSTGFAPSAHLQAPNPGTPEVPQNNGFADVLLPAGESTLLLRLGASREAPDALVHAMGLELPASGPIRATCFKPLDADPLDLAASRQATGNPVA